MFANVGWGEMLVLVVLGLVILGPERLPGAIRWTSNTIRQAVAAGKPVTGRRDSTRCGWPALTWIRSAPWCRRWPSCRRSTSPA